MGVDRVRKSYRSDRAFRQARAALERWAPERILTLEDRALVLRWIPGESGSMEPDVHEEAGRWLRSAHDGDHDDRDIPLVDAFRQRIPAELDLDPTRFAGTRVWCHRDFHPDNWVCGPAGMAVIDFEHSRPDHPGVDLVRLATEIWTHRPALREAFRSGYGDWDPHVLEGLVLIHAHRTLAWGLQHDDPHFTALGRTLLANHSGGSTSTR